MKRAFLSALIFTLLFTTGFETNVFASTTPLNGNIVMNGNSTSIEDILSNAEINTDKVNIVNIEDCFSNEDLKIINKETEKQDKLEKENGLTRISTIVTEPKLEMSMSVNNRAKSGYVYFVEVVDTYTGDEEILNKRSNGMSHWLDASWNLAIGSETKYIWKAATVLGINPSNYLSNYKAGDKLSSTKTKVVKRKCYKKYNPTMNQDVWYLETRSETIKNYVDLYTFDKMNNSVRKSDTDVKTFYSKHYKDVNWINNYVNKACAQNQQVHYTDSIE